MIAGAAEKLKILENAGFPHNQAEALLAFSNNPDNPEVFRQMEASGLTPEQMTALAKSIDIPVRTSPGGSVRPVADESVAGI